jgi:hypothetical protein
MFARNLLQAWPLRVEVYRQKLDILWRWHNLEAFVDGN